MLFFYKRDDKSLRVETRFDNDTSEFTTILHYPDGAQEVERFRDAEEYRVWLVALENRLEHDRWTRKGPPVILPDGWPKPRTT